MMKLSIAIAALGMLSTSTPVWGAGVMSLTRARAADKIEWWSAPISGVTQVSTQKVAKERNPSAHGSGDLYLQGRFNRMAAGGTFQLVARIQYWGTWRFYEAAEYYVGDDPVGSPLSAINRNVETCLSAAGCKFQESFAIDIPEETLRNVAAMQGPWQIRFMSSRGGAWNDEMSPIEVQEFLRVVDRQRSR